MSSADVSLRGSASPWRFLTSAELPERIHFCTSDLQVSVLQRFVVSVSEFYNEFILCLVLRCSQVCETRVCAHTEKCSKLPEGRSKNNWSCDMQKVLISVLYTTWLFWEHNDKEPFIFAALEWSKQHYPHYSHHQTAVPKGEMISPDSHSRRGSCSPVHSTTFPSRM